MATQERKPILKPKGSGKFQKADFQREDIARLLESGNCALWNEMGTFKTTTVEWLWEQKLKHIPNPRVLVITTKTGKGAYMETLPEVLPEWDVFSISSTKTQFVINGTATPWDVELPDPLYFRPVVVIAHYQCFLNKACEPQQVKKLRLDDQGNPVYVNGKPEKIPVMNEDGTIKMTNPRCNILMTKHWDAIIVDEAHRMKNKDTQWTRNIKKLKAGFKVAMTGTGFVNNPSEIWSILNFLHPKTYSSYWSFREHYCEEDYVGGYRKIVGIKPHRNEEFRELVRQVGTRRTMAECFPDIAEPMETVVPVSLSPIQAKMYNSIADELWTLDQQGTPLHSPTVLSALTRLRQICVATPEVKGEHEDPITGRRITEIELKEPSSKLDAAMEVIEGLEWDVDRKDQVVVFSNFRGPLELLRKRLEKAGIPFLHLKADHTEKQRYDLWHETWPKKEHQVFLCTLGVGSESINLTTAHRAIFLDQSWSPAQNAQAIGRVYRPGQKGMCQLIYIRAEATVDYRVLGKVTEKAGWFRDIFGERPSDS
ncbi:MAG TPA: DEAD/DEAH box helicase [Nitrososphaera sp.]